MLIEKKEIAGKNPNWPRREKTKFIIEGSRKKRKIRRYEAKCKVYRREENNWSFLHIWPFSSRWPFIMSWCVCTEYYIVHTLIATPLKNELKPKSIYYAMKSRAIFSRPKRYKDLCVHYFFYNPTVKLNMKKNTDLCRTLGIRLVCVFFSVLTVILQKNVNVWKQMLCLNATKLWTQQPNKVRLLVRRKVEKKGKREKKTSHKRENSLLFIARQILIQIKLHLSKTIFFRSNNTKCTISPGWTTRSNCAGERLN